MDWDWDFYDDWDLDYDDWSTGSTGYIPLEPQSKTCKYCGAINLWWRRVDAGWRLHDSHGQIHTCRDLLPVVSS